MRWTTEATCPHGVRFLVPLPFHEDRIEDTCPAAVAERAQYGQLYRKGRWARWREHRKFRKQLRDLEETSSTWS